MKKSCALVALIVLLLTIAVACTKPLVQDPVSRAKVLLDSWEGSSDRLQEAKLILDKELAKDSRNYRALVEFARYQLDSGYLEDKLVSNGQYKYYLDEYSPNTLQIAKGILNTAIHIEPKYAPAYIHLAHVYSAMQDFPLAEETLEKARDFGADKQELAVRLGVIQFAEGRRDAALVACQQAEQYGTGDNRLLKRIYTCLLDNYKSQDKQNKTIEYYKKIVAISPDEAWPLGNLASYLRCPVGDLDGAVSFARQALDKMDYGNANETLALALYGKWAQATAQGVASPEVKGYFDEAYRRYPYLDQTMAYLAAEPCSRNAAKVVKAFQTKGISIDAKAHDGSTALLIAVNTNRNEVVRTLLTLGASPNVRDQRGWTPLLSAADEGNKEVVTMLLERGADRTARMNGLDAPGMAERRGHPDLAAFIRQSSSAEH